MSTFEVLVIVTITVALSPGFQSALTVGSERTIASIASHSGVGAPPAPVLPVLVPVPTVVVALLAPPAPPSPPVVELPVVVASPPPLPVPSVELVASPPQAVRERRQMAREDKRRDFMGTSRSGLAAGLT